MPTLALTLHDLSVHIDSSPLIDSISLNFTAGNLYTIVGPNGAGKTTLLKAIAGMLELSEGAVYWNRENLHAKDREEISKIVTLVPQNPNPTFAFTVLQLVLMGRYPHGRGGSNHQQDYELAEWTLKQVNAWDLRDRIVTELSGGERQRIYIARALVTESPILLLDEPTSSLDVGHTLGIWTLLKTLSRRGHIIITTTHNLTMAERFADNVILLNEAHCIAQGPYHEVITATHLQETFGVVETAITLYDHSEAPAIG